MTVSKFGYAATKVLGLVGLTFLMAACGAGGGEETSLDETDLPGSVAIISGTAVKGVIEHGLVRAYLIENKAGKMVKSASSYGQAVRSDSNGRFSLITPVSKTNAGVIVEISADDQTTMKCDVAAGCGLDQSGSVIPFGSRFALDDEFVLQGIASNLMAGQENTIHITSLSHLAVAHAQGLEGGLSASNITTGISYVETAMGLDSGALRQAPADLTRLDQLRATSKSEFEVALMSASFLALVNSPDWNSINEILDHAAQKMSASGALTSANMGSLPDVAMDDLYYQAGEITQALMATTSDSEQTNTLTEINDEIQLAYAELTNVPEEVAAVVITQQPVSVTVDENESAGFSVSATGGGELTYQWRKDGVDIDGAESASFNIDSAVAADAGLYDVIVANAVGSEPSLSVLLTVDIEQALPNNKPVAVDDAATTDEDVSVTVNVVENDSDVDGDSLSVTSVSAISGTAVINTDNTITYTPASNFNGSGSLSYAISDGQGGSASASVTITVTAVNDNPVAVNDTASTSEDTALSINVVSNDTDVDGDSLSLIAVGADMGSATIVSSNTLRYTPAANQSGAATIIYTVSDGQGGTATASVTMTISAVNDQPVAVNDTASTSEDSSVSIDVLTNDSDADGDSLSVSSASSTSGDVTVNDDQSLSFTPATDFNGVAVVSYTISDGQGGSAEAAVNVTVSAVNDQPVAVNDAATTEEDSSVTIDVLANDSDIDGDSLSVSTASATNGAVTVNGDQSLSFTPAADFHGIALISYTLSDGQGGSASASVSINVGAVNDQPVAVNDSATTSEDSSVTIDVLANDSDSDGGSLSVSAASASSGEVAVNSDQSLLFTPVADFNGTVLVSYTLSDGQGGAATATVNITVSAVNDDPVAVNDSITTYEDSAANINVLTNDSDVDGDSLTVSSTSVTTGTIEVNGDQSLSYTPAADFNGTALVSYTISDGQGGSATASVNVTVSAVNDQPVAVNDSASTNEDSSVNIDVLANDSDVDGDSLTLSSASASTGSVTVNGDQSLSFTPATDFNGTALVSYTISDGNGETATASVTVVIGAINDDPVAVNDATSTDQEVMVNIDVLSNDTDVDGDTLSLASASASNGTITLVGDGTFNYTPSVGFSGEESIAYVVSDGQGGQSSASVTVTVNAVASLASIELSWDIPTERENGDSLELYEIDGYMIAYGSSADSLTNTVYVSGALVVTHVIEELAAGTYYFAIATVDSDETQGAYSSTIETSVL